jgi:hypothetical protein
MQTNQQHDDAKSSAYLWGRCEGWAQLGRHHAVVIDVGKGEARDEKSEVLARWVGDGSEKSGCRDYLALAFGDLEAVFLVIRNSEGVWAKNCARDITG